MSRVKETLRIEHLHSGTAEVLSDAPQMVEKTFDNASAFAHAMHVAVFEHPEAFGVGHKAFSVQGMESFFLHPEVTTFGVGQGNELQAGVSVVERTTVLRPYASELDDPRPQFSLEFLFQLATSGARNNGRRLAATALEHILDRNGVEVGVLVTSNNTVARKLYRRLGFQEIHTESGKGFKLVRMRMVGQENIEELHNKLRN